MTLCYVLLHEGETPFTKKEKTSEKLVTWKIEQSEWKLHKIANEIKSSKFHKDLSCKCMYRERPVFTREEFFKYLKKHTGKEFVLKENKDD